MSVLRRLSEDARRLVTPALAAGQLECPGVSDVAPYLQPFGRELSLEGFDEALSRLMTLIPRYDTALDAHAAVEVHRTLGLSRRDAADPGVWRYLSVVHRPDFIRHRWENNSWATMKARFWNIGTRPDSNTLARLWWIAELTREGTDYALTHRVLQRQSLANAIFVRSLSHHRPAVRACVNVLEAAPGPLIDPVMLRFSRALSTIPLESRTEPELEALLRDLLAAG